MKQASNRTVNISAGATALVGRTTPISSGGGGGGGGTLPTWAQGAVVDKAMFIPNTAGLGGSPGAYSGWTNKGAQIIIGLASGHKAGYDNSVNTIDLLQNTPAWVQLMAPSTVTSDDTPYYPDGKPAGRHVYQMMQYVPALDMPVWAAVRFTNPNAGTFTNCDAFDLAARAWKTPGYIESAPGQNGGGVLDYDGVFHAGIFSFKLDNTTRKWVSGTVSGASGYTGYQNIRHPWATDFAGRKVYGMAFGDGEGFNPELGFRASVMRANLVYPVTIAPGAALTQFMTDKPTYAGMDYDAVNGDFRYLDLYNNRFYKVVVANDNTGVMTMWTPDMSAAPLPAAGTPNLAINPRFTYIAALKGFVIGVPTGNLIFIKTSP